MQRSFEFRVLSLRTGLAIEKMVIFPRGKLAINKVVEFSANGQLAINKMVEFSASGQLAINKVVVFSASGQLGLKSGLLGSIKSFEFSEAGNSKRET